jgi:phosphomannomutase
MSLMTSISGVRGIVGETLTPEVILKYTSAFAEYCRFGKIVVGRDGRSTGNLISNLVISNLLSSGCDVVELGIAPTPTIGIAVEQLHADGGIAITASHNPMEWNGLKFIGKSGLFLNAGENKILWSILEAGLHKYARWNEIGRHLVDDTFIRQHIDMVMNLPYLRVAKIQQRRLKVAVDCINAAGGVIVPMLLRGMGCDVVEVNCDVSGIFSRTPEPVPENLTDFARRVREERADVGIVVDPDVDRLVLITETGEPFGEEYTITAAVKFVLGQTMRNGTGPQSVVVNLSTTLAVEDVAKSYGANIFRTPVGEINVASKMKEVKAIVGGEGSGGVILPAVHYGRDAIVGIGLILQYLVDFGGTLSELRAQLPSYIIIKSKFSIEGIDLKNILSDIQKKYAGDGEINTDDGLKIRFDHSWVHLRLSNTEPIVRVITEAPTREEADALLKRFQKHFLAR